MDLIHFLLPTVLDKNQKNKFIKLKKGVYNYEGGNNGRR